MKLRLLTWAFFGVALLLAASARSDPLPFSMHTVWSDQQPVPDGHRRFLDEMIQLEDGRFVLLGTEASNFDANGLPAFEQLVVVSVARDGTEQWRRFLDAGDRIAYNQIVPGPDGSIFVCDSSQNYYRLDVAGDVVWHVQYDYRLESTCLDLAYHPGGLLLVAGGRTFGRDNAGTMHREAALTAYDASDGHLRWQTGYRLFDGPAEDPNNVTFNPDVSRVRVQDRAIDWLGWADVDHARIRDHYPWSVSVGVDGTILAETPVHKLMAEPSFGERAFVDFAPFGWTLLMSNDVYEPRLVAWQGDEWRRPRHRRIVPYRAFGWDRNDDAGRIVVLGANEKSATLLFCHCSRRDSDFHLDFYQTQFRSPEATDDNSYSLVLARSADLSGINDVVAELDFELRRGARVFLLVGGATGRGRIEWLKLEQSPILIDGNAF